MTTFTTNFALPKPAGTDAPDGATQIGALADATDLALLPTAWQTKAVSASCSVNDTTTSASYASLTSTSSSVSFIKRNSASALAVDLGVTVLTDTATTNVRFGVLVNGVDYDVCQFVFSAANIRHQVAGTNVVAAALAAGTYTVQIRWRRAAGPGIVQRFTPDDWQSLSVTEVNP